VEKDINWRNIPKIEQVTVHSMIKGAIDDSAHLHVGGIMLQAITGVRPTVHKAKHSVAQFGIRVSQPVSLTCTLRGDQAYEFVDKCINLVFPKIKDWPGVKGEYILKIARNTLTRFRIYWRWRWKHQFWF